ncbi:uncharacterized protein [Aegilops tauschii subsp. strangulata]
MFHYAINSPPPLGRGRAQRQRQQAPRRSAIPAATPESESPYASSSWASLAEDLLDLIGWRVLTGDLLDYVRLRAACRQWRSSTVSPGGRSLHDPRFYPRRWMLLPEGHGLHPGHTRLHGYIRFINLSTGAIVRSNLPIFSDHCVLDSVDGILVLKRDHDTAVRLLHPFTGDIADLPPLASLRTMLTPGQQQILDWSFFRTICATSFTVSADGVVTAMIALFYLGRVACATSMDQQWRLSTWSVSKSWRPMSFQGKIYTLHCDTLDSELQISQIDLPGLGEKEDFGDLLCYLPEPKLIATFPAGRLHMPYHLGECDSEIMLIGREECRLSFHIGVYRVADILADKITPVTSIGGNALFVEDRVLSVSSRVHPTIVADAIVLLHQKEVYLGQYHLASRTWLPTADGGLKGASVPSPCSLIYHIFTCCYRILWNKGQILFQGTLQPIWRVKRKGRLGC